MTKAKVQAISVAEVIKLMKANPATLPDWIAEAENADLVKVHNDSMTLRTVSGDQNLKPEDFLVMDSGQLTCVTRAVWDVLPNG